SHGPPDFARNGAFLAPALVPSPAPADIGIGAGSTGAPSIGPNVIKTGQINVKVRKGTFSEAFAGATQVAFKYRGFVQTSSTQGDTTKSGSLVIRVPASRFELAVNDLSALGIVQLKTIQGADVTSQFI